MRHAEGAVAEMDLRQRAMRPAADRELHRFEDFSECHRAHTWTCLGIIGGGEYRFMLTGK